MWEKMIEYIPSLDTLFGAIVVFIVPYGISKFFEWIRS
jgi:hypothetical protein